MGEELIELRKLPGIARVEGLCLQPARWDYPTRIDTMSEVNDVSIALFSITRDDTFVDEDTEFLTDEGEEPFTPETFEERFNATRAEWTEARIFFEAIGWDISDGKGNELVCAHWFARQIIAVTFDLVEGATFTPDGSGRWSSPYESDDEQEDEEAMAERLERDVAAFLTRRDRR